MCMSVLTPAEKTRVRQIICHTLNRSIHINYFIPY
jgi:hypothetical protein